MITLDQAKSELARINQTPDRRRSTFDNQMAQYYQALITDFAEPSARSVATQLNISKNIPFGSPAYIEEAVNLLDAIPDELDPKANRIAQLGEVGERIAISSDQPIVETIINAIESKGISLKGRQIIIAGIDKHPSFGSYDKQKEIKARLLQE